MPTYEESRKNVRIVAIMDMVLSIFPIAFYTVFVFIFGFVVMIGFFNSGYVFLDWVLANTMSIEEIDMDFNFPGPAVDVRMFRCSVWGIAILFNLMELTMAFVLQHALKTSKTEQPFLGWLALKGFIIFVMFVLIIALLSTGSRFLGVLFSILYLIYRGVAFFVVYKHVNIIRDQGGIP